MELSEWIFYLLKVVAIQGVFYLFYRLVLSRRTRHALNRYYLLSTLILSFLIPFIHLTFPSEADPLVENRVFEWVAEPIAGLEAVTEVPSASSPVASVRPFLIWGYIALVLLLISRSFFHLVILQNLKKQSEYVKKHWFTLFKTAQLRPFSFFSNVFMPRQLFGTDSFDQVLAHECVHVRQRHSMDRLLVDFLVALLWFNPFIYLYRRALIEVHEYQADATVIQQYNDLVGYQEILYAQLRPAAYSGPVSHLDLSIIKKRIVMMNKVKNKQSVWTYLVAVPVTLMVIFAFSTKETASQMEAIEAEIAAIMGPPIPEAGQEMQKDFTPSILPLKATDELNMSSGFGRRDDPDPKRKFHRGMDFKIPLNTEIFATADGVVNEIQDREGGYGMMVILKHGDVFVTRYAHLGQFKVKKGDVVRKGDVIALSGNSGASKGPHLHYEVIKNGKPVNPASYIKNYTFRIREIPPPPARNTYDGEEEEEIEEVVYQQRMEEERARLMAEEERLASEKYRMEAEREKMIIEELKMREKEELMRMKEAEMYERERLLNKEREVTIEEEKRLRRELMVLEEHQRAEELERRKMIEEIRREKELIEKEKLKDQKIKKKDKKKNKDKNKDKN